MRAHVFGPVPSRRLGRSLGIDLAPFKTCSYDCIYCQLGHTTCLTVERKEWVPLDEVVEQARDKMSAGMDYVTLSGSGEPTLFSRLGELISSLKSMTSTPIAVLTNGSLLWDQDVRNGLAEADLIVPSLDAGDETLFRRINRAHESIAFENMANGLIELRNGFKGDYWLEVFMLGGMTADNAEVEKIGKWIKRIRPDRVQLNTVTRPPAEEFALPVSKDEMERYTEQLGKNAEVIADFRQTHTQADFKAMREDVLDLLRRRPCTVNDVAGGLGMHVNEAVKYLNELIDEGKVVAAGGDYRTYYKAL